MGLLQKYGKTNVLPVAVMSHSTKFSQDEEFSVVERKEKKGRGEKGEVISIRGEERLSHHGPSAQPIPWS